MHIMKSKALNAIIPPIPQFFSVTGQNIFKMIVPTYELQKFCPMVTCFFTKAIPFTCTLRLYYLENGKENKLCF